MQIVGLPMGRLNYTIDSAQRVCEPTVTASLQISTTKKKPEFSTTKTQIFNPAPSNRIAIFVILILTYKTMTSERPIRHGFLMSSDVVIHSPGVLDKCSDYHQIFQAGNWRSNT